MNLITAALLGALQGLTEFLPVSSTAHLLIAERLLGFDDPGSVFAITIQFGSILAVMWLYRAKIASVVRGLPSDPAARRFALMIIAAFMPAAVAALALKEVITGVLHNSLLVMAWAFVIGGIVMLAVERWRPRPVVMTVDQTPVGRAVAVGFAQAVALIPGVSRSGATMVGGMLAGLDRAAAAELSFFLAMPTMAAAFVKDLWDVRDQMVPDRMAEIGVGFVMAFIAAFLVVKPFLRFVTQSGFAPFAWYRIALGIALLVWLYF